MKKKTKADESSLTIVKHMMANYQNTLLVLAQWTVYDFSLTLRMNRTYGGAYNQRLVGCYITVMPILNSRENLTVAACLLSVVISQTAG